MGGRALLPWVKLPKLAKGVLGDADVVHLHTPWEPANALLGRSCVRVGVPYVVSSPGLLDDWSMGQSRLKKLLFLRLGGGQLLRGSAAMHFTAEAEQMQASKWCGGARGVVVPLIMDLSEFVDLPSVDLARDTFAEVFSAGEPVVLFLSRLHPKKGADRLLEAVADLQLRGEPVQLVLAGPSDETYLKELMDSARDLGIEERCHFVGMVGGAQKLSLYRACDVFALPTSQENFGFVFFESLACGTPVVTTTGADTWPGLEKSGGCCVVENDGESISRGISRVVASEGGGAEMGRAGCEWVLDRFAAGAITDVYTQMYASVR